MGQLDNSPPRKERSIVVTSERSALEATIVLSRDGSHGRPRRGGRQDCDVM